MIFTIAHKEFRSLFASSSTWLMLGGLQFIFAWFFLARMDEYLQIQAQLSQLANAPGVTQMLAGPIYATLALILMMLVPIFTMRLLAEERRNKTLIMLLSAPISTRHIVLGKFLSLLLFLLLIVISATVMVCSLAAGTALDFGLVFSNAVGLFLLCSAYAALGLYVSSLTVQPLVAAISSLAALFGLLLLDIATLDSDFAGRMLAPSSHFQSFNIGLPNSTDVVYFVLFVGVMLLLTIRRVDNNRIYG